MIYIVFASRKLWQMILIVLPSSEKCNKYVQQLSHSGEISVCNEHLTALSLEVFRDVCRRSKSNVINTESSQMDVSSL